MTKRSVKVAFAIAVIAAAGACGGNNATNNGGTNNGSNNGTNNGTVAPNNGTGNNTTNNDPTNNPTNNDTTNNDTNNETNNGTVPMPLPEPPKCTDAVPPARCAEDPTTYTYGPASVMDTFFVEGTDADPVCCFDYTGDGEIDNALGMNLASFGFLEDINLSVQENIDSGSLVLVLEHEGLDALDNDDSFVANFYIAAHEGEFAAFTPTANPVLLDPQSFEMGAHPQALLPDASVTAGAVVAGPGSVRLEITLFDSPLTLTISQARIEADLDAANSALDASGVSLAFGKLGGAVKVVDVFNAVNAFAAGSCECLGLGAEPLVDVNTGMCSANADGDACTADGNTTCAEVKDSCGILGAVAILADVDLDGDGEPESISIGAAFTAVGAEIKGVSP